MSSTVLARLEIDLGSRGAIDLSRHFLAENHIDASPAAFDAPLGAGVGGATQQRIGRLASVDLGGIKVNAPITSFSTATTGAQTSPDFDGLLGDDVLRRFDVTVDYPHQRLLLRRNARFDEPFEYDMSGLLLVSADAKFDRVVIKNVLPSSPAAEAGLAAKDEIVSIDGKPASAMKLDDIRDLLRVDGRTYTITIKRGSEEKEVRMTTRRMV